MNLTRYSIKRPIGISMIVSFFVVLGLYSYYLIGVELLPALNTPFVSVTIKYPGANAESIEQQVIKPVEDALSAVSDVKKMTSMASYERARIMLELEFYANADSAAIDATKKVNAIRGKLPDEVEEPVVIKRDMNATPIVELAITSDRPWRTYTPRRTIPFRMLSSRPPAYRRSSCTAAGTGKSPLTWTRIRWPPTKLPWPISSPPCAMRTSCYPRAVSTPTQSSRMSGSLPST